MGPPIINYSRVEVTPRNSFQELFCKNSFGNTLKSRWVDGTRE